CSCFILATLLINNQNAGLSSIILGITGYIEHVPSKGAVIAAVTTALRVEIVNLAAPTNIAVGVLTKPPANKEVSVASAGMLTTGEVHGELPVAKEALAASVGIQSIGEVHSEPSFAT